MALDATKKHDITCTNTEPKKKYTDKEPMNHTRLMLSDCIFSSKLLLPGWSLSLIFNLNSSKIKWMNI